MFNLNNWFDIAIAGAFTLMGSTLIAQHTLIKDLEEYRDTQHACQLDIDVEVGHQMALNQQWKEFQEQNGE